MAIPHQHGVVDPSARKFALALIALTLLPIVFFGALSGPLNGNSVTMPMAKAIWLAGVAHVGMTGTLWFDQRYRQHIRGRPFYFYAGPAALATACILGVQAFGDLGFRVFTSLYTIWLFYHFGRQNWGLLCLISTAVKAGRPSDMERQICQWAPVAGMAGALIGAEGAGGLAIVRQVGFAAGLVVAGVSLAVAVWQFTNGTHPIKTAMTVTVGLFFLPVYVFGSYGAVAVGVAHAYQYILVMICMDAQRRASAPRRWFLPLTFVTVIYVAAFFVMNRAEGDLARPLAVLWNSIIIWHFIIDADVWRLSQPFQRQVVKDNLPYLFR